MAVIQFEIEEFVDMVVVSFVLQQPLSPEDLKGLTAPDPIKNGFASGGVILSGRGPIWLYGWLVHYYHPTRFVAVFDPRLDGAVVVESHSPEWQAGDVINKSDWS